MKRSSVRILTSHAGSLPRPDDLIELNRARQAREAVDEAAFRARLGAAVADVVRRQKEAGIDIAGDGEYGKAMGHAINYGAWWSYSFQRLGGLELTGPALLDVSPPAPVPGKVSLTSFAGRRDREIFAAAYADPNSGVSTGPLRTIRPTCTGPLRYVGHEAIRSDIANFKAGLAAAGIDEGFMTSIAPGSASRVGNTYYKTEEEFIWACADAMREEYVAIIEAGLLLQLDDPAHCRELGHDQSGAARRGLPEVLDDPGGSAQPCPARAARRSHSLSSVLGELARSPRHRYSYARHRRGHAGRELSGLFLRGGQCPPRA